MSLKVKDAIGEYKIMKLLGEGLTSCVYKAIKRHCEWDVEQTVALKVFKSHRRDSTLKQEIQNLLKLDSLHCVKMLGWMDEQDLAVLVLEYLEGVTLHELIEYAALTAKNIGEIIAQTQEGLRDLQRLHLRHGDLSPRNIFITKQGLVKLLDFGFSGPSPAKAGTVPYLSPEGWRGENLTIQSDLFSLGLIMHELEGGEKPRTIEESQRRARRLQNKNSLLCEDETQRHFLELITTKEQREDLATMVKEILAIQDDKSLQQTCLLGASEFNAVVPQKRPRQSGGFWCCLLILFYAQILHPETNEEFKKKQFAHYRLEVRSLRWAEVRLSQKREKGWHHLHKQYTPFFKENLPAGRYRVDWISLYQSGHIFVQLKKNQRILLP
jgi:serine/threonine protein kinase